jgi:hypothetical protein
MTKANTFKKFFEEVPTQTGSSNEFVDAFKSAKKPEDTSKVEDLKTQKASKVTPEVTPEVTSQVAKASEDPKSPKVSNIATSTKPQTAASIFKKLSSLESDKKKLALKDVVKVIQSNGAKWVKEIMSKRKMVEEFAPDDPMAFKNFKYTSQKPIKLAIAKDKQLLSAWEKADRTTQNTIADYVVTNALKEFDKEKGKDYWADTDQVPMYNKPRATGRETISAQNKSPEEQSIFDKLSGAASDFKSGFNDPMAAADSLAKKVLGNRVIKKQSGGTISSDASIGNASTIDNEVAGVKNTNAAPTNVQKAQEEPKDVPKSKKTPKAHNTNPKAKKTTKSNLQQTNSTQEDQIKNTVFGILKNDEAGKKITNIKNLETIAHGAANRKTAHEIVLDLKKDNNGTFEVTNDIRHLIGKALGEVGRQQDTSQLSENKKMLKQIVNESFYMKEEASDEMKDTKEPEPGDIVWYVDLDKLEKLFKDPKTNLQGKVRFNKFKVEFMDINKKDVMKSGEPLKEHVKNLFYEADEAQGNVAGIKNPSNQEAPTNDNSQQINNEQPKFKKTDKNDEKFFDKGAGTAKVIYVEGPEKGKEFVVKIKDLELSVDLMVQLMQFAYYQGDLNSEKAGGKYRKNIAKILYNLKNKKPINSEVPDDQLDIIMTQDVFKRVLKGDYSHADIDIENNPEALKVVSKANKDLQNIELNKEPNAKTLHLQLLNFNDEQKKQICKSVANNKPLTKKYVLDNKVATNTYDNVPSDQVTRVNYAKGMNWFKVGGMIVGTLDRLVTGKLLSTMLNGLSDWLGSTAKRIGDMAGTHDVSKRSNF